MKAVILRLKCSGIKGDFCSCGPTDRCKAEAELFVTNQQMLLYVDDNVLSIGEDRLFVYQPLWQRFISSHIFIVSLMFLHQTVAHLMVAYLNLPFVSHSLIVLSAFRRFPLLFTC